MIKYLFPLLLLASTALYGDVRYINYDSFPQGKNYEEEIHFVMSNQYYMEIWTLDWPYDIDKDQLIGKVEEIFNTFKKVQMTDETNPDLCLFLGDLAHFLYNLDAPGEYSDLAIEYYNLAMKIEPRDFRPHWFLGLHLTQSARVKEGMEKMLYASTALPPLEMPPHFWLHYLTASSHALMFRHSLMAADYYEQITGEKPNMGGDVVGSMRDQFVELDPDMPLTVADIWIYEKSEERDLFTSYFMGISVRKDPSWEMNFFDYDKEMAITKIVPPAYKGFRGESVTSTILNLIVINSSNQSLREVMDSFVHGTTTSKEMKIELPFDNYIAYAMEDPTLYTDQGGGKLYMIGISAENQEYSGTALEYPIQLTSDSGELSYFNFNDLEFVERCEDEVFYIFILDACDSIFEDAYADYYTHISENVIIE